MLLLLRGHGAGGALVGGALVGAALPRPREREGFGDRSNEARDCDEHLGPRQHITIWPGQAAVLLVVLAKRAALSGPPKKKNNYLQRQAMEAALRSLARAAAAAVR